MFRRLAAAASCLVLLVACGGQGAEDSGQSAATVSVAHAQGTTEIPQNPQKVVVIDNSSLGTLDLLGVEPVGVAKSGVVPAHLSKYADAKYADVGTLQEPNLEKIAELGPDLIVISARTAESYPELTKIAPTIDLSVTGKDVFDGAKQNAIKLGTIFGKQAQVDQAMADLDAKVATTRASAEDAGKALVVMVSGGKLSAFGPGSRFGLIHDTFGVQTAAQVKAEERHGEVISFEFIAKADPDIIYVIDRDAAIGQQGKPAAEVLNNELVNKTKAAQNQRIVNLDGSRWYLAGGGLNDLGVMADEVAAPFQV